MSELAAAGGWCAPGHLTWLQLQPELDAARWPVGLTAEDLDWLARMIAVAEVDPDPPGPLDLPAITMRRGGITFPA